MYVIIKVIAIELLNISSVRDIISINHRGAIYCVDERGSTKEMKVEECLMEILS